MVDAPGPQNKEQLCSFLREYMSKFVKNFASKTSPLRAMMKDKVNFVWDETHQKVFDHIKSEIAKRPTLSAFDSSLNVETILTSDASQYGLGAVLSQVMASNNRLYSYLVHYPMPRKTTPLLRKRHSRYTGLRNGYVHFYGSEDLSY